MGFLKKLFGGEEKKLPLLERTLTNIQIGDIISYFENDYEVYAVIEWMQEGYTWKEYKLKNREDSYWISAEVDDGEIVAGFYAVIKDLRLTAPFPEKIEHKGIVYYLEEKGHAVGKMTSEAGTQNYKCSFYEYLSEDEKNFFSIEDYGGEIEMSTGEVLKKSEINILPGG